MNIVKKFKILHVVGGLVGGGAERQLKLLLSNIDKTVFAVGVIYLHDDNEFLDRDSISFFPIKRSGKLDIISVYISLEKAIKEFQPDLMHLWYPEVLTIPAAIIGRRRKIPLISTQRHRIGGTVSLWNAIRDRVGALAHCLSSKIVTNYCVDFEPDWFKKIVKARKGTVIPNAVSIRKELIRPSISEISKSFRIVFVGRFVVQKRLDILLNAVSICRNYGCPVFADIYGRGSVRITRKMEELCQLLEIEAFVQFHGYSDWQGRSSDYVVLVHPSITEGMPNVVVEAMALGIPVVASDIPENRSFIRGGIDACLVPPDDSVKLALVLMELQQSLSELNRYRQAGFELAEKFSLSRMIHSYQELYYSCVRSTDRMQDYVGL